MGLNDLMNEIKQDPNNFIGDESIENKVLRQVLKLVEDKISEVKNQAVKWYVGAHKWHFALCTQQYPCSLGQLIKIMRESQMEFVVDSLIHFLVGKDEELRDISGLGKWSMYRSKPFRLDNVCSTENDHVRVATRRQDR